MYWKIYPDFSRSILLGFIAILNSYLECIFYGIWILIEKKNKYSIYVLYILFYMERDHISKATK